jgi:hypothetical protein
MLNNVDKLGEYGLSIMMKAEKMGRRMLSRIIFTPENATFQYVLATSGERADGSKKIIPNMKKVQISDKIKENVHVELSDDEKSIKVLVKANKEKTLPELVLLTTDGVGEIQTQQPAYNEQTKSYEYHFEDLEPGKYFLFVDPGILR